MNKNYSEKSIKQMKYVPFVLESSTKIISLSMLLGERFKTLYTVLRSVEKCSL